MVLFIFTGVRYFNVKSTYIHTEYLCGEAALSIEPPPPHFTSILYTNILFILYILVSCKEPDSYRVTAPSWNPYHHTTFLDHPVMYHKVVYRRCLQRSSPSVFHYSLFVSFYFILATIFKIPPCKRKAFSS